MVLSCLCVCRVCICCTPPQAPSHPSSATAATTPHMRGCLSVCVSLSLPLPLLCLCLSLAYAYTHTPNVRQPHYGRASRFICGGSLCCVGRSGFPGGREGFHPCWERVPLYTHTHAAICPLSPIKHVWKYNHRQQSHNMDMASHVCPGHPPVLINNSPLCIGPREHSKQAYAVYLHWKIHQSSPHPTAEAACIHILQLRTTPVAQKLKITSRPSNQQSRHRSLDQAPSQTGNAPGGAFLRWWSCCWNSFLCPPHQRMHCTRVRQMHQLTHKLP